MRRIRRGVLVAALSMGTVFATGSGAVASGPTAPPKPPKPPKPASACRSGTLRTAVLGSEGAAGSVYVTVGLTNVGKRACVLRGHPGVAFAGPFGRPIGGSATWTDGPGKPVTLAPGGKATVVVRYVQAGIQVGCDKPNSYRPAAGLRIIPPGDRHATYVRLAGVRACVRPSVHQLSVGPVTG